MTQDRDTYAAKLAAMALCVAARIPFLLWGEPGGGKTAVVESAKESGWHVETLICSHYEPSDFAGLPIVTGDHVSLAPPGWAKRVAAQTKPSIVFFDEWTTASPAVQAAALRPLTHAQVGALQLPDRVSFGAAANPADVAASGWELAAPTANRFVHIEWSMPLDVYSESIVTGQWPRLSVPAPSALLEAGVAAQRSLLAAFLQARAGQLSSVPKDAASRGRAFPTPRTWDYVAQLLAWARASDATEAAVRVLVHGAVGAPVGHEYLAWLSNLDLPDPEDLLADPQAGHFHGLRPDRVHVALQSVLAAVVSNPSAARWTAGMTVCVSAADQTGVDPAIPVVRALLRVRPGRSDLPAGMSVFAAPLALAGMLPT